MRVNSILGMGMIVAVAAACSKDRKAFEQAEVAFNAAEMERAIQAYDTFVAEYPTSQWRVLAETQRTKAQDVVRLRAEAESLEVAREFDRAIASYQMIAQIHPTAADTGTVLPPLRLLAEERKVEIEREAVLEKERRKSLRIAPYRSFGAVVQETGDSAIRALQRALDDMVLRAQRSSSGTAGSVRIYAAGFTARYAAANTGARDLEAAEAPSDLRVVQKQMVQALDDIALVSGRAADIFTNTRCTVTGCDTNVITVLTQVMNSTVSATNNYTAARERTRELLSVQGVDLPELKLQ